MQHDVFMHTDELEELLKEFGDTICVTVGRDDFIALAKANGWRKREIVSKLNDFHSRSRVAYYLLMAGIRRKKHDMEMAKHYLKSARSEMRFRFPKLPR